MKNKILIVDDDLDIVQVMSSILTKADYLVGKAYGGAECIEKLEKNRFDAVILDIMMPKMDGYEVAKSLKKKYGDTLKIIYLSIVPKADLNMENADGFIQKPFNIDEVLFEVDAVFID